MDREANINWIKEQLTTLSDNAIEAVIIIIKLFTKS